ncbi:hypothetical protein F0A16_03260 [Salinicola corii]|uniref:ATPase n=1 Tax=Salinicola corii TaxID=2606937 RepID=A0A640WJJ2_9GAMM|nr:hypothetical protein [Salinicola corii]KAA0020813.1 hypothetical protein F0A16_03260 [Salinicola corii]
MSQGGNADGNTQTRNKSKGQDAYHEPADQLFYMVGKGTILAVPREDMPDLLAEMRLLESVVESQQQATSHLKSCQDKYIQVKQSSYFKPEERAALSEADSAESLEREVILAQSELDKANRDLIQEMEPLTQLSDNTNHISELIPIQRRGGHASAVGFRMTYVRSQKIQNHWRKYRLTSRADTTGGDDSVITQGKVDWKKLKNQLTDIGDGTSIKVDIPWFDDWMKLEDQHKELFQWSEHINENLQIARSYQSGGEHDVDSLKVDLSAEAQLMRWSYGASGVSGEANPFKKEGAIKSSGHAELMLAEAKASIDCYEPPGGYMMAFAGMNLGMLRSHTILSVAGGIGASIAAELNIDAEFTGSGAKAKGVRGSSRNGGIPGKQTVDMSLPDNSQGGELGAFIGGQLEATVAGQVEWKSPESEKFEPFAKIAPAIAGQIGIGGEATLKISYQGGKFRIFARAALCYGVGAKGKLILEVDATLIYEFAKWVTYQLKNINYKKLDFIDAVTFEALSNMLTLAVQTGEDIKEFMYDSALEIQNTATAMLSALESSIEAASERGELVERINANPDILRYTTPDSKGALLYRLMQRNAFDNLDGSNRTTDITDKNFWRFGYMTQRKRAIIRTFTWIQSQEEYHSVMKRIKSSQTEKNLTINEGEEKLLRFLALGETGWWSSHYADNLKRFYNALRPKASKGEPIVRNDMTEYLTQLEVSPAFEKPCFNTTLCKPSNAIYQA